MKRSGAKLLLVLFSFLSWGCIEKISAENLHQKTLSLPNTAAKPQVIQLDLPVQQDERVGGLITADINNDALKDFIITKPDFVAAYAHSGQKLWTQQINIQVAGQSEKQGLPGWHAPGVQAADVDGDLKKEVLFLTKDNTLEIVQGNNGEIKHRIKLPKSPKDSERWEHLVVANFRGKGESDLLLQTTNTKGYRLGRYLAAYAIEDLIQEKAPEPLWTLNNFFGSAHNGARVADLNGDGTDEVLGGTIVSSQGKILFALPLKSNQKNPHIDSIFVADVRPDIPGLEVVALEEGGNSRQHEGGRGFQLLLSRLHNQLLKDGNRIFLYNSEGLIWETHFKHQEPQNAAVGDFDPERPGLEVWCRSRYNTLQKPFVFDAQGQLISTYEMNEVAPQDWAEEGVEVIHSINWTGEPKHLAAAKERHKSGDVAIFDPISGKFLYWFEEKADRLYVADVSGDWREELIVLNTNQLHIYANAEINPNPDRPRLWTQDHYRRNKMTWNYYSP